MKSLDDPQAVKNCPHCQKRLSAQAEFCLACGTSLVPTNLVSTKSDNMDELSDSDAAVNKTSISKQRERWYQFEKKKQVWTASIYISMLIFCCGVVMLFYSRNAAMDAWFLMLTYSILAISGSVYIGSRMMMTFFVKKKSSQKNKK